MTTATTFVVGGTAAGAGISSAVGGMGLVGSFGGIGIGAAPILGAGAITGMAAYGAFRGIAEGDRAAFGAIGLGAVSGVTISSAVGTMGLGIGGGAIAVGMGSMAMAGGVFGLGIYGVFKIIDDSVPGETAMQAFDRVSDRIEEDLAFQFYYTDGWLEVAELSLEARERKLKQKFIDREIDDELKALKDAIGMNSSQTKSPSDTEEKNAFNPNTGEPNPSGWNLIHTIKAHRGKINAIAFGEGSQTVVTAGCDRTINFWNCTTGKRDYTLFDDSETLSLSVSSDSEIIAGGNGDGKISLWSYRNRQFLRTLSDWHIPERNMGAIAQLCFVPNSSILISGSGDKTVRVWDAKTGNWKRIINGHEDRVLSVAVSSDGEAIAGGSTDRTIRIWHLNNYAKPRIFAGHNDSVTAISFSPDNRILVSGSADRMVKLWSLKTGECLHTLTGHKTGISAVAFSPDGGAIASADSGGTVRLWNAKTGQLQQILSGCVVAFSLDRKYLASGGPDGTVKIWRWERFDPDNFTSRNWWQILKVNPDANLETVRVAYRKLARLYHPDRNFSPDAIAKMQRINSAYEEFLKMGC